MNALTMKLESRHSHIPLCKDKNRDSLSAKKCKSSRKKSVTLNCDKDALLSNHGLGRKSGDIVVQTNDSRLKIPTESSSHKKHRFKNPNNTEKMPPQSEKIQERLDHFISSENKAKISSILSDIRALSDVAKLYLYLQLPTGSSIEIDQYKQKTQNPLGKKADEEGLIAVTWIQSHLEEDPDISLPKQEVYDEYQSYCHVTGTNPLCAADFGKVMKQIFPSVKPRRLGTRGNSRYCYSGLRKKLKLKPPSLPDIQKEESNDTTSESNKDDVTTAACHLIFEWAEKLLGIKFTSLKDLSSHLLEHMYVDNRSVAAFTVLLESSPQLLEKGLTNCEGGVKKSEAQMHLQRKIQEKELIKEQKRKLQEQRTSIVNVNKRNSASKKKSLKPRKPKSPPASGLQHNKEGDSLLSENKKNPSDEVFSVDKLCDTQIKEECDLETLTQLASNESSSTSENIEYSCPSKKASPEQSPGTDTEDKSKINSKVLISRSKTPVCIAQNLSGIIIVPPLPQLADIGKPSLTTAKYKRIQPKPIKGESNSSIRSRAGSVGSTLQSKPKMRNNDGRRSSHAWLQSDCSQENQEDNITKNDYGSSNNLKMSSKALSPKNCYKKNDSVISSKCSNASDNLKLGLNCAVENNDLSHSLKKVHQSVPLSEVFDRTVVDFAVKTDRNICDDSSKTVLEENSAVKRHLEENACHTAKKRPHLEINKQTRVLNDKMSTWTADNCASNISSNLTVQNPSSQQSIIIGEEVSVHEIEGDALNDYFRIVNASTAAVTSPKQNDVDLENKLLSCNNKVKQLSQLRMLLEQNLPHAAQKSTGNSSKGQTMPAVSTSFCSSVISESDKSNIPNCKRDVSFDFQSLNNSLLSNNLLNNQNSYSSIPPCDQATESGPEISSFERLLSSNGAIAQVNLSEKNELLADPSIFLNSTKSDTCQIDTNLHSGLSDINQNIEANNIMLSSNVIADAEFSSQQLSSAPHPGSVCTYTQVPSVPQSPNTRRRAFNFMPISPRRTPISDVCNNGAPAMSSPVPNHYSRNMVSTAVGPSQPPSNAGSPFVSPRSTPVPPCRSRHSSGQSTYSTSRHTPFQSFDSGVSSVSSSPFISPQPTPIPVSRLRHNSSHGSSKTVTFCSVNSPQIINSQSSINGIGHLRTRHSSGPGGPQSSLRNAPLSPLVSEHCTPSSFLFSGGNEVRSRHNSGSNTTSLSPVSEQASSSSSCTSNLPDLSSVTEASSMSHSFLNDGAGDLLISANPTALKQVRQRHASGSVIYNKPSVVLKEAFSQEIQKLLKNSQGNSTPDLSLSQRSQSVPLHQMLQNLSNYCFISQPLDEPYPKSHPTTPVMNQLFSFPLLNPSQEPSLAFPAEGVKSDKSLLQSSNMEWTGLENTSDIEGSSARRNLSALLDAPLSDDLQTTLEDLRDCDTDFSKFAQELELSQNEELELSQN